MGNFKIDPKQNTIARNYAPTYKQSNISHKIQEPITTSLKLTSLFLFETFDVWTDESVQCEEFIDFHVFDFGLIISFLQQLFKNFGILQEFDSVTSTCQSETQSNLSVF